MPTFRIPARDLATIFAGGVPGPTIASLLEAGEPDGHFLRFDLDPDSARGLVFALGGAAANAPSREARRTARRLADKLHQQLERMGVAFVLDEAALERHVHDYNHEPQPELGGLSPHQVRTALANDWSRGTTGLQLHPDSDHADLESSDLLHNARTLITALADGGVKATAKGNLTRALTGRMLEEMRWPDGYVAEIREMNRVINEMDVWKLHVLRVILEAARLIARRKGGFSATRRGRDLARPERAGELLVHVFENLFRKFNLAYGDRLPDAFEFQRAAAFPLAVLCSLDDAWHAYDELWPRLLLPAVAETIPELPYMDAGEATVRLRLLDHLERAGVIECRREKVEGEYGLQVVAVRKTPLYDQLIRFDDGEQP